MFGKLKNDGLQETEDRVGGYQLYETGAYKMKIKTAFGGKSSGGALSLTIVGDINGKEYSETLYVTNKNGENFFLNPQDKTKKVPLPGFSLADDLAQIATGGKFLSDLEMEDKIAKVWDKEEGKQINKSVPTLVEVMGAEIGVLIYKNKEPKTKKNDQTGEYEPTGETRETNTIEKFFDWDSKLTIVEAREAQKKEVDPVAQFIDKWVEAHGGKVRDKTKGSGAGNPANKGAPPKSNAAPVAAAAGKSLFGKKP